MKKRNNKRQVKYYFLAVFLIGACYLLLFGELHQIGDELNIEVSKITNKKNIIDDEISSQQLVVMGDNIQMIDYEEIDKNSFSEYSFYAGDSVTDRENALKAYAPTILANLNFGDDGSGINYHAGTNVCHVILVQSRREYSNSEGRYDVYYCDDKQNITLLISFASTKRDNEGKEFIEPVMISPYADAVMTGAFGMTAHEVRGSLQFSEKEELPMSVDAAYNLVTKKTTYIAEPPHERNLVTLYATDGTPMGIGAPHGFQLSGHMFSGINPGTGERKDVYVHPCGTVLDQNNIDQITKENEARQIILTNMNDEVFTRLEKNNELEKYLNRKVPQSAISKKLGVDCS